MFKAIVITVLGAIVLVVIAITIKAILAWIVANLGIAAVILLAGLVLAFLIGKK